MHHLDAEWRNAPRSIDTASASSLGETALQAALTDASYQGAVPVSVVESVEVEKRQSGPRYWAQYRGVFGQVMPLGSNYKIDCPAGFWGERVRYDWQMYG